MVAKSNSGFTLIELVIVVAILGIIATAVLTGTDFLDQRNQAKDVGNYNIARNLQSSIEQYYIQGGAIIGNSSGENDINNDVINVLVEANILKSGYKIDNGFKLINTSSGPKIKFPITSSKFQKSTTGANATCDAGANFWFVPSCGQLK